MHCHRRYLQQESVKAICYASIHRVIRINTRLLRDDRGSFLCSLPLTRNTIVSSASVPHPWQTRNANVMAQYPSLEFSIAESTRDDTFTIAAASK